jgi:hypothetical protein
MLGFHTEYIVNLPGRLRERRSLKSYVGPSHLGTVAGTAFFISQRIEALIAHYDDMALHIPARHHGGMASQGFGAAGGG